ncbi:flagellar basal-body rod protein FlgB [Pseudohongiella acticola]|jgi:flagellar basal-body rod protein FlgB|uniref:Flagellar basal body rod protein FlgB n=1 Tax=Pseudohongiella acticola TaxID=1524254 RepID=A0A1E8CGH7_9GAMM|nr:flagellar basal body rod protein FlgB [Pseudohongiella acticola]OFE11561.1 flagellar basal-body rod protein FlgB [Pseudohongiella acticola]
MAINFANALGVHEHALTLRTQRTSMLASNIANADTPGYKARDMDFGSVLAQATSGRSDVAMQQTHTRHITGMPGLNDPSALYRVPSQPSVDGNTVDEQIENAAFARNALEHQASFQFLNGKFTGMIKALKGE